MDRKTFAGSGLLLCVAISTVASVRDPAVVPVAPRAISQVESRSAAVAVTRRQENDGAAADAPADRIDTAAERSAAVAAVMSASLKERFLSDPDLAPLFEELIERAGDGDGEAAYYAYRIHELCFQRLAGWAVSREAALESSEPAQPDASELTEPNEPALSRWVETRRQHLRRVRQACSDALLEQLEHSGAGEWLEASAELGFPLAQAQMAHRLFVTSNDDDELAAGHRYLRAAARSRDPETLFEIGRSANLGFLGSDDPAQRGNAWLLVACWHGLDCSADGPLVGKYMCPLPDAPRCIPGADLPMYLERWDPEAYPATYALADQMMQAMNDGRWEDLGL